jgi:hypothetical protein
MLWLRARHGVQVQLGIEADKAALVAHGQAEQVERE